MVVGKFRGRRAQARHLRWRRMSALWRGIKRKACRLKPWKGLRREWGNVNFSDSHRCLLVGTLVRGTSVLQHQRAPLHQISAFFCLRQYSRALYSFRVCKSRSLQNLIWTPAMFWTLGAGIRLSRIQRCSVRRSTLRIRDASEIVYLFTIKMPHHAAFVKRKCATSTDHHKCTAAQSATWFVRVGPTCRTHQERHPETFVRLFRAITPLLTQLKLQMS